MDTDTKSNSEEGDNKESSEVKNDSGKEIDGSRTDGDGDDKTDTEEGEGEEQKKEKMEDVDVSDKAEDKTIDTTDKKEEVSSASKVGTYIYCPHLLHLVLSNFSRNFIPLKYISFFKY